MVAHSDVRSLQLNMDIRRAILLSRFIRQWGLPLERTISTKKEDESRIEVYEFSCPDSQISRFVTIGISGHKTLRDADTGWELLFCLPKDLGGVKNVDIVNYLLDISVYSLRADTLIEVETTIPESSLAPSLWTTKAILFDEARGEPEDMSCFHIGQQSINLFWLIPLTNKEYKYIKECGQEAFDNIADNTDIALIDVNRDSIV